MNSSESSLGQVFVSTNGEAPTPSVTASAEIVPSARTANQILSAAIGETSIEKVLVLAFDDKGQIYTDTNIDDGGDVLWLVEFCKAKLMKASLEMPKTAG